MTSNSDSSTPQMDQNQIESEVSSKPNSDFANVCETTALIEPENYKEEEEEETESTASSSSQEVMKNMLFSGAIEVPENDDGFKTPTDQMIPEVADCPGAPKRQRKTGSRKRKAMQIEFSDEVESMFAPAIQEDLGRENKRARSEKTE